MDNEFTDIRLYWFWARIQTLLIVFFQASFGCFDDKAGIKNLRFD